MSGESRLIADPEGKITQLVRVMKRLHADGTSGVVVGGIAVLGRVAAVYRVTDDLDHVAAPASDLSLILAASGESQGRSSWLVDEVKVDLIEVGTTPAVEIEAEAWPDELDARWFAIAHQWAYDTAEPLTIEVWERGGARLASATVRAATSAALCAMKLQSAPRRPAARRHKAGSDYTDLYRLLDVDDPSPILDALARAPGGLGAWAIAELHRRFGDGAERTVRMIRAASNVPRAAAIAPADLRRVRAALP